MRRRPFVLLEVLIAIAIVALVATFLLADPMREAHKELGGLFDLERERFSELDLMEIKQELPERVESLPEKNKPSEPIIKTRTIEIDKVKREVKKTYYLRCPGPKVGPDGTKYYKVKLFEDKKQSADTIYTFFVTIPPKNKPS